MSVANDQAQLRVMCDKLTPSQSYDVVSDTLVYALAILRHAEPVLKHDVMRYAEEQADRARAVEVAS